MPSSGPNNPASGTDDASFGDVEWINPGNVLSSDNSRAEAGLSVVEQNSHYLVATDFGFSITAGATIDGIVVEIEKSRSDTLDDIADGRVRIVKGGAIGATDRAAAGQWDTTDAYTTYGSSTDKWGETWTDTDTNATNFGAAITATSTSGGTGRVDHMRITVYYTDASGHPAMARGRAVLGMTPGPPLAGRGW